MNEEGRIVEVGVPGEIQVKSFSLFSEYRNEEAKTREVFTADGFFKTGYESMIVISDSLAH